MATNREYHLRRVIEMQEMVLQIQDEHRGLPYTKIYRQYIKKQYHISYSTYRVWLGMSAKAQLTKIEASKELKRTTKI